jgi:NTE family protein
MPNLSEPVKKTALVLQGGGARGAYHVGAIKAIAEITERRRSPFKIVCGASVGSINAASIAVASNDFQAGARHLEDLWRSLNSSSIFNTRAIPLLITALRWAMTPIFTRLGFPTRGGLLDCEPLRLLLQREFNRSHLRSAIRTGSLHALSITASSYKRGEAVAFFEGVKEIEEWSRSRRRGTRTKISADHILASAALPFAFAPVKLEADYYGDGSLRLTSPLSPAIHLGADRILVITTRDGNTAPRANGERGAEESPSIGEMAGHALDILFNDSLEADHERMTRINQTISLVSPEARQKSPLRVIETVLLKPSRDMRDVAKAHAKQVPWAIRFLLQSLGPKNGDGRIESYLMFEPDYIGALIDMGYADTMNRADAILDLLRDS